MTLLLVTSCHWQPYVDDLRNPESGWWFCFHLLNRVRLHRCWWRMLETKWVGEKLKMLVTDPRCWWPIKYIGKIATITKTITNIMILSPTSQIGHHHIDVTNITVTSCTASYIRHQHLKLFTNIFCHLFLWCSISLSGNWLNSHLIPVVCSLVNSTNDLPWLWKLLWVAEYILSTSQFNVFVFFRYLD